MTILKEHAWDRPDSWQPICIAMRLYVSRSLECIPDLNIHRFDDDQVYRQVNDLVNKRNFHCIDHVGWSLGRLCHDWPVQLAEIEVLTLRRNLKVEGRMKKEWIWIRDKEAHCGHFAAQKLIIQNPEFDCIIGVNRHERAQKQTVRVTIHVDWEDNKPITCPGLPEKFHINWKGLMRNIREVGEVLEAYRILWLFELIVYFASCSSWKTPRVRPLKHLPSSLWNLLSSTHSCTTLVWT